MKNEFCLFVCLARHSLRVMLTSFFRCSFTIFIGVVMHHGLPLTGEKKKNYIAFPKVLFAFILYSSVGYQQ